MKINGKKTYLVALAMIGFGVYTKDYNLVMQGLAAAGIRHGITKDVAKPSAS